MSGKDVRQPTPELVNALSALLWDNLEKVSDNLQHDDRRQIAWGSKTEFGLAASILRIVDEQMPPDDKGGGR